MLTQLVTGCCCCLEDKTFFVLKSWVEEGVDTVGDGVLLLFGGQDVFGNLGRSRVLTQLVTGCCCCLEDNSFFVLKSWVEEGVDTVGDGVLLLFGGQDIFCFEILGGGGC